MNAMQPLPSQVEIADLPEHVQSWSAARIAGFVPGVLDRWQREFGALPRTFHMLLCPQVEVNMRGGLPPDMHALTDARLTCHHFTGCHKPYLVALFQGKDSVDRCRRALTLLAWSEGYAVEITASAIRLRLVDYTEDLGDEGEPSAHARTLQDLLRSGELVRVLK
jgi:hypothetical protein